MDSSLGILGAIAFVLFHLAVTLPLATLVAREILTPWLKARGGLPVSIPEWAVVVALFVVMALAFALRGHVVAANGARHVYRAHAAHHHAAL